MTKLEEFKALAAALGAHLQGDFEGQALLSEIEDLFRDILVTVHENPSDLR